MTAFCHTQLLSKPVTLHFLQWLHDHGLAFLSMVLIRVSTNCPVAWENSFIVQCFACFYNIYIVLAVLYLGMFLSLRRLGEVVSTSLGFS